MGNDPDTDELRRLERVCLEQAEQAGTPVVGQGCCNLLEVTGPKPTAPVDGVPGTTEARKPTGYDDQAAARVTARAGLGVNEPTCNDMSGVG
jgi:hypothetical protein